MLLGDLFENEAKVMLLAINTRDPRTI